MLGITTRAMRHRYANGAEEARDALARDWPVFLARVLPGEPILALPNVGQASVAIARDAGLRGLIFSGGEDWGVSPERDATESALLAWARAEDVPVFGVCRGAQVINRLCGGSLAAVPGHVATRHPVALTRPVPGCRECRECEVNSFHALGIPRKGLAPGLAAFALAPDGTVEGFADARGALCGILWHPERANVEAGAAARAAETAASGMCHETRLNEALLRAWLEHCRGGREQPGEQHD